MAQIIEQGPRNLVVKFTAAEVLDITTLSFDPANGPPKYLQIEELWYDVGVVADAAIQWVATVNEVAWTLSGQHHLSFKSFGGLVNTKAAGATGSVAIVGTGTFSLVVRFKKSY